ncbi:MAG: zinc-ribbon domain-containing protein [Candidatus Heimdallarchaeota archaeon]|nr:zinc-ribbon domain-containing protein [Candidatus Heimdallarchaeota archaeon]MCK4254875.1 zinc-ribbon domain-containing protein [Candidatus Heimdallarchaeota archaeon]
MKLHVTLRFCENCHTQVEDDATFCFECGHELKFLKLNSSTNQSSESKNNIHPTIQNGSSPNELTYAQQDIYGKQQGKNYRRKRLSSRMISRIISFAIMMAIIYTLGYIFLS